MPECPSDLFSIDDLFHPFGDSTSTTYFPLFQHLASLGQQQWVASRFSSHSSQAAHFPITPFHSGTLGPQHHHTYSPTTHTHVGHFYTVSHTGDGLLLGRQLDVFDLTTLTLPHPTTPLPFYTPFTPGRTLPPLDFGRHGNLTCNPTPPEHNTGPPTLTPSYG